MNIHKIIREEVEDFDWIKNAPSNINSILDDYFGIYFEQFRNPYGRKPVNLINSYDGKLTTFHKLRKTSVRKLYKILTGTSWFKGMLSNNVEYSNMRSDIKKWLEDRVMKLKVTPEVQNSGFFTGSLGPR